MSSWSQGFQGKHKKRFGKRPKREEDHGLREILLTCDQQSNQSAGTKLEELLSEKVNQGEIRKWH
jgi:hypothetical protein